MNHVIISGVLLIAFVVAAFVFSQQTKVWQSENQQSINETKKQYGKGYTLFPKNHTRNQNVIGISIIGSFLYLLISLLILFFGH